MGMLEDLKAEIDRKIIDVDLPSWDINKAFEWMDWYLQRMKKYGKLWYDSLYKDMDKYIKWVIPWKVYTIWAYSNVGKSRWSYWWVNHFLKMDKKVIFFSLEVDSWMVIKSLVQNYFDIPVSDLYDWYDIAKDSFENLQIYDDVYDLEMIEMIVKKNKPDFVFIDFIQNIQTSWSREYEKMSKIAKALQRMAIVNKCSVFSLSQLSNEMGKNASQWNTDFVTLKWAWELFASSDVIFLLSKAWDNLIVEIVKNKYGDTRRQFEFEPAWDRSRFRFLWEYYG